jgi:hypothetical protein
MTASRAWRSQLPEPRVAGPATYRLSRSAPGRRMFGASARSRSVTFSSLAASLSSVARLRGS